MNSNKTDNEIEEVKNRIINNTVVIGSLLGSVAFAVSLIEIIDSGIRFINITDSIAILILALTAIYRKRIKIKYKSTVILSVLALLIFTDVYFYGEYSNNKILLIIIPLFSLLGYSFRSSIIIFSIGVLGYISIGYLYISGIISTDVNFPYRLLKVSPWLVSALTIIIISIVVVIILQQFNSTFIKLIDNLKAKNIEIAQREQSYREIFDSSTDAIVLHDMQGNILDVNKAMLKMYEYENINSVTIANLSSGIGEYTADKSLEHIKLAIKNGVEVFDWQAKKQSGKSFWVEVALKKTHILGNERILAIVRDINERKETAIQLESYRTRLEFLVNERTKELKNTNIKLELTNTDLHAQQMELQVALDELQTAQKQLISAEKMSSLGVLAAGVAHEINNPLNYIQGGVSGLESLITDYSPDNTEDANTLLNAIQEGVTRVTTIVSSLNHFSRQNDSEKIPCNIHSIIDNCLVILKSKTKDRIDIVKNFTSKSAVISGNDGKLHQALLNILSNAIEAIKENGKIEIKTEVKSSKITISIKDSGVGISEENITKINDPFFTTKAPGKGTGLGLSITYSIIEEHLGNIKYKSEINRGTLAIISLPL